MITISKHVEQLIERWPMLNMGISLDLLNTSSLARYLKPEIEKLVGGRVSDAAILMAIRRYRQRLSVVDTRRPEDFLGDISLRTNLHDLTFTNSPSLPTKLAQIAQKFSSHNYLTISRGLFQTSLIVHDTNIDEICELLAAEEVEKRVDGLSALTLQIKRGYGQLPGILAYPLQLLAWRGIPIVELVSTYDELHIILYDKDTESAFSILNQSLNTRNNGNDRKT